MGTENKFKKFNEELETKLASGCPKEISEVTRKFFPHLSSKYNQYEIVLEKTILLHKRSVFQKNRKRYLSAGVLAILAVSFYKAFKWYYILYYYFMYDIDIRKPKVSDFFMERYR